MQAFQHQGRTLRYITVHPNGYDPDRAYPLVILLHGFGASMADLAGLAPGIDSEGYVYAFPNGPLSVPLAPDANGYSWIPPRDAASPEEIEHSEGLLADFFDEVMAQYKVSPKNAVLGGFSQGGGMTYRCGLGNPDIFAGLVVLSGSLPNVDDLRKRLPEQRTQPIFVAHGTEDAVVPIERAILATEFLIREKYQPEFKQYVMGHEINQQVLNDLVVWLQSTLPPLR